MHGIRDCSVDLPSHSTFLHAPPSLSDTPDGRRLTLPFTFPSSPLRRHLQLEEYGRQMRDAENESHEGKRVVESTWPIMRISHTRSRWIYELYYKREAISKELYDWLCDERYADVKSVAPRPRAQDTAMLCGQSQR